MELKVDWNYWIEIILSIPSMEERELIHLESDLVNNHYDVYSEFRSVVKKRLNILYYEKYTHK